jgi:carboxypeptidase Taq
MAAAQLMKAARTAIPSLDAEMARGELLPLVAWLREKLHSQGARLGFQDLLRHATGKPLDPADYTEHLRRRYLG